MKVFVVGNINSGKTFYSKKIQEFLPNYEYLAIDNYRIEHGDGTYEGELKTRDIFANDILVKDNIIVEYTGGKTITDLFIDKLKQHSFIVIEVKEDLEVCLKRLRNKNFSKIPYPKFEQTIEETIKKINHQIDMGMINDNFKDKFMRKFIISNMDELNEVPFTSYDFYFNISEYLSKRFDSIFTYGSLGRGELKRSSDLDFYVISEEEVSLILNDLKEEYKSFKIIKNLNQIVLINNDLLVEVTIIKNIEEARRNYSMSEISDIKRTIVKSDGSLFEILNDIVKEYKPSIDLYLQNSTERLVYYQSKIRWIIAKNDLYKFNFFNNIIIHEYIKIKYLLNKEFKYLFLPSKALNYLSEEELDKLTFNYGDDPINHCNNIDSVINSLVNQ